MQPQVTLPVLRAANCKQSFWDFIKEYWDEVPGSQPLQQNWHMEFLANELQEVAERVFRREKCKHDLVINIPPGTSKSTICTIMFPDWVWTRFPKARFICASNADDLVSDLASKARDLALTEKFRESFPYVEIRHDKSAVGNYHNTAGGSRISCTVAGKSPIGRHGHFLIIDDPLDPKKAVSEAEIKTAKDFMTDVIPKRKIEPKEAAVTILIMQRLHREDPTAVMLARAKIEGAIPVRHICLPAELTDYIQPPELKEQYVDGLLDSKRMSDYFLKTQKADGAYSYASQFLQSPVPLGGGMFKIDFFNQRIKVAPYKAKRVRSWDRASSISESACNTAGTLMARDEQGYLYVEHCIAGQWEPHERNQKILAMALRDKVRYPNDPPMIFIEDEGGSTAKDANRELMRVLAGHRVIFEHPTGSKDVRAEPWASQLAAGLVYIVDNDGDPDWDINGFIEEHIQFKPEPGKRLGKWKDRVDSSSQAMGYLLKGKSGRTSIQARPIRELKDKRKFLRLVVCPNDFLAATIIEQRALLIRVQNVGGGPLSSLPDNKGGMKDGIYEAGPYPPPHACTKLLDEITLTFDDVDLSRGDRDYDRCITADHGKKMWGFLTKKRDPMPEIIVFAGEDDRRIHSVALAVADVLKTPRNTIYVASDPEMIVGEQPAGNMHIYDTVKRSRERVI